jgi:hypothetical protein
MQRSGLLSFAPLEIAASTHMRCRIAASLRATATVAFCRPALLAILIPHAFNELQRLTECAEHWGHHKGWSAPIRRRIGNTRHMADFAGCIAARCQSEVRTDIAGTAQAFRRIDAGLANDRSFAILPASSTMQAEVVFTEPSNPT